MSITLVTHNAYWFQGLPFEGQAPGAPRPEIVAGLAAHYRSLGADLICLQEMQSQEALLQIATALGLQGHYQPGGRHPQYGGGALYAQGLVAGWDGGATETERFWFKLRMGGACRERVVANVHLPSGVQTSPEEAARQRLDELAQMLSATPLPDLVAGDFNEPPAGPAWRLMQERGYRDAALSCGAGGLDTHTRRHSRRVDYIWVRAELAGRLRSYRVVDPSALELGGGRFLSDHLPVMATLEEP